MKTLLELVVAVRHLSFGLKMEAAFGSVKNAVIMKAERVAIVVLI